MEIKTSKDKEISIEGIKEIERLTGEK